MFKVKYTYQKGGPEYKCSYPSEEDSNHNIYIIKGRNDQGKSTLMQMIALGLYGEHSDDIAEPLKRKMLRLRSKQVDRCEFDFVIISRDGKTRLESSMKDRKITVKINGDIRGQDYVKERFKMLFDVPEESTKKLAKALGSIEFKLGLYEGYVQNYHNEVNRRIESVEDYQDREERIEEEEQTLENQTRTFDSLQMRLKDVEARLDELRKAHIVVSYERLENELGSIDSQIRESGKRLTKLKQKGAAGGTRKYQNLVEKFEVELSRLKFQASTSDSLLDQLDSGQKKRLEKLRKEIDTALTPRDLTDSRLKRWHSFFDGALKDLESRSLHKRKLAEEDEVMLLDLLIPVLKDFIDIDAIIPGTDGKRVAEFIGSLEERKDELETKLSEKLALNKAVEACKGMVMSLGCVVTAREGIPRNGTTVDSDYHEIKTLLARLEKEFAAKARDPDGLESKYNSIPEAERDRVLIGKDRDKIGGDFEGFKDERENLQDKLKKLEIRIGSTGEILKELRKTKKPVEDSDIKELRSLHGVTSTLIRKMISFREHISNVDLSRMDIDEDFDDEARAFYDALGDYFAFSLKLVYFENKSWNLRKVNLVNQCYEVKGRKAIDFIDIGTGHTALNALLARMKQDYGGKKKILLFDEIGHMDKDNVDRLLHEIRNQVERGEVIFAMLNQMDNSVDEPVMVPVGARGG